MQFLGAFPSPVGKPDDSVSQFRPALNRLCEANGAAIGAYDEHVSEVLAAPSKMSEPASDRDSSGDHRYRANCPKKTGKAGRNHSELENKGGDYQGRGRESG